MKKLKLWAFSIQNAMILAFSLITLSVIATTMVVAYRYTMQETRLVSIDYISQLISQVNSDIDRYVSYMEDVTQVVEKNASILAWIKEGENMGTAGRMVLEDTVYRQMSSIANARKDITNIGVFVKGRVIFDTRGKMLNDHSDYEQSDWYVEAVKLKGKTYVSTSHVQNVVDGRYNWVVSMSKAIMSGNGDIQGVLLVDLNYSLINSLCEQIDMGKRGYLFLQDRQGDIIFHPKQQLILSHLFSENVQTLTGTGENSQVNVNTPEGIKLYLSNRSELTGWTVVGVAYQDEILRNRDEIYQFYFWIFALFLAIAIILAIIICSAITNPLKRLITTMQEVRNGGFDERIEIEAPREAALLSAAFNTMMEEIKALVVQREKAQEQRRQSELIALQAQINPHFLYNTLDSIIWMAENKRNEEVVEMTVALARLFRSSISEPRELVPFSVELANIKSYLTIQQMRYKEKLRFMIDVPRELEGYLLPKLMLQPLVENAIYHGIKPRGNGGRVDVSASVENDKMIIIVSDDGVGMDEEKLRNIFLESPSAMGNGIGVKNVNERIKLIFGEQYGLEYFSQANVGTKVVIVLPYPQNKEAPR